MSQFITRKFGLESDSINSVRHIFLKFRDFENKIITKLLSQVNIPGFIDVFRAKAKTGYKIAYDFFNINKLTSQTYLEITFKERMKRAATYYPYFAIRNFLIRKDNLTKILDILKVIFQDDPSECVNFIRNGTVSRQYLIKIKDRLTINLYKEKQRLSIEYLTNHINQLRNLMLNNMISHQEIDSVISKTLTDPSLIIHLISETLNGFTAMRKKQEIKINQEDLIDYIKKLFISSIKRKSTRLFKISIKRGITKTTSPLLQKLNPTQENNLDDFKDKRDILLNSSDISIDIDLHRLCKNVITDIIESIVSADCLVYKMMKPNYKTIPIISVDKIGFTEYLKKKIHYKAMSILPDIIFRETGGIIKPIIHTIDIIKTQLSNLLKVPRMKTLTINLPFREQLWKNGTGTVTNNSNQSFIFTPLKGGARTSLKFSISNTTRKEDIFPNDIFDSPPILKLDYHKLILIQPFKQKGIEIPDFNDNIEMGIDLGLKHFAVISIQDKHESAEIARYFLDQKIIFGNKFNPITGTFNPLTDVNWNIKRKLMHLRTEIKEVQSKKSLYEEDFPNSGKRHFHIKKTLSCLWQKINHIHLEIRNQLSHKILQIALFHNVSLIKFEDLSWAQHSRKIESGKWIAYHQIHWFHSKIIEHVLQAGIQTGIQVGVVNARWSSQICSFCAKDNIKALNITMQSKKGHLRDYFGSRSGKLFRCEQTHHRDDNFYHKFELDADLNAARNVSMRPLIRILT